MRNRLTVARGFIQLIRKGKAHNAEQQEKYLGIIEEQLDDAFAILESHEGVRFTKEGVTDDRESVPGETDP